MVDTLVFSSFETVLTSTDLTSKVSKPYFCKNSLNR